MSRSARLLELLELLRQKRRPVAGTALAEKLGISLRTLYRDIATLQAQGANIEGEAGVGYVLRPGFTLPPLMFSEEEIHAISLGAKWVVESADDELSAAAQSVLAKIADVVSNPLRIRLATSPYLVGPASTKPAEKKTLNCIRKAIQKERKLAFDYIDGKKRKTTRTVWPFGLTFFENSRLMAAWCEKRQAIRHFRTDRIQDPVLLNEQYPCEREELMRQWMREMLEQENFTVPWPC